MNLPTSTQIATGTRYAATMAGTAAVLLGLSSKGVTPDQITAIINSGGALINDIIIMIGAVAALLATYKGVSSSSPVGQAAAIGANISTLVKAEADGTAVVHILDKDMAKSAVQSAAVAAVSG